MINKSGMEVMRDSINWISESDTEILREMKYKHRSELRLQSNFS